MEEIIDYIPEHLFGKVIGTGGSGQTRIYNATGARLNVTKDNVLKLKGSAQQRELAHPLLRRILAFCGPKRKVFATDKNTKYVLQNAGQDSRGNIYFLNPEEPKDKFSFNYKEMKEFQEYLLQQIQKLNEDAKNNNGLGDIFLHVGRLSVSTEKEENVDETLTIEDIIQNHERPENCWILKFQNTVTGLSPHKLASLPKLQSYVRYDISIASPTAKQFLYKVYMEEGGKKLCRPEELAIPLLHTARRVGLGLLWSGVHPLCRVNILLPKEFFGRLYIDIVYPDDELQDQGEEEEEKRVIESFCKEITAASIIEKNLPKLPTRYYLEYFRQCERMDYDFHPNILIVSKEKELINTDRLDKEEELLNIRLLNKDLIRLLETPNWTVDEVMDIFPEYIGFIGQIFDYLGN